MRARREEHNEVIYSLKMSMVEVYNETVRDLLVRAGERGGSKGLEIRQGKRGPYVDGAEMVDVATFDEAVGVVDAGNGNRAVGCHDFNAYSSRSHSVLTIHVIGVAPNTGRTAVGKLNLIDLAGSERVSKTQSSGDRLKEACNINRSLSAVGDVLCSLAEQQQKRKKAVHIPYRNSKLTYLLQDSLEGGAKVLMFVNISPALCSASESLCSLAFAERCNALELGAAGFFTGAASEERAPSTPLHASPASSRRKLARRSSFAVGSPAAAPPTGHEAHAEPAQALGSSQISSGGRRGVKTSPNPAVRRILRRSSSFRM